jgi:hypothetical protein
VSSASEPTIQDLLARFLADQRARLAPRTYRNYEYVVELLSHCLNAYAYQGLNELDRKRWEKAFDPTLAWPEPWFAAEMEERCQGHGRFHTPGRILEQLIARSALTVIAREPDYCGGDMQSAQILAMLNHYVLDGRLRL